MHDIAQALEIGESIIETLHESWLARSDDDLDLVIDAKCIMTGIDRHLARANVSTAEREKVSIQLYGLIKKRYIRTWVKNGVADKSGLNESELQSEGSSYFDYVFEHEEHSC